MPFSSRDFMILSSWASKFAEFQGNWQAAEEGNSPKALKRKKLPLYDPKMDRSPKSMGIAGAQRAGSRKNWFGEFRVAGVLGPAKEA